MSTSAESANWRSYGSLLGSILLMGILPTVGLIGGAWLLDTDPMFFGKIWNSKYDVGGRLWLLAGFVSTWWITGAVVNSFIVDPRFNAVRDGTRFAFYAKAVSRCVAVLPLIGLMALFLPASWGGVWSMKVLALLTALLMWLFDKKILEIVAGKDQHLQKIFHNTVRLIDRPTTGAVALILLLAPIYLRLVLPNDVKYLNSNEIFVMGLSSGAVAVELWFANLLFWLIEREGT